MSSSAIIARRLLPSRYKNAISVSWTWAIIKPVNISLPVKMTESVYYFKRHTPFAAYVSWLKVAWTETPKHARKWPIITLGVLAFTMTVNIVQYRDGAGTVQHAFRQQPWVAFLYPMKMLGVDTLRNDLVNGLLSTMISFVCLGTVEMAFLTHGKVFFFLLVNTMFSIGQWSFLTSFCRGELYSTIDLLMDSYCCGSFLVMGSLGLVLMCVRTRVSSFAPLGPTFNWPRQILSAVIVLMWLLAILNDYYYHFQDDPGSTRTCESFTWHAMSFLFGVVCGAVFVVEMWFSFLARPYALHSHRP